MTRYFAIFLLALGGAIAQEPPPRTSGTADTNKTEVRKAIAVTPAASAVPEVRRAIPVTATNGAENPIRRAVAVTAPTTAAETSSPGFTPQSTVRIQESNQHGTRAQMPVTVQSNQSPTPAASPFPNTKQKQSESIESPGHLPESTSAETVKMFAWGAVGFVALLTITMLTLCHCRGTFMFLHKWDIALSLLCPIILILALFAATGTERIWIILSCAFLAAAILGSLATGWRTTGSIFLSLLILIPKIIVILVLVLLGVMSASLTIAATQLLRDKKFSEAARSAGLAAGSFAGCVYLRGLIERITIDNG